MHHYTWKGIDASGNTKRGTLSADTPNHLKDQLLLSGVALLSYSKKSDVLLGLRKKTGQTSLITFFEYLGHLIESGIPLLKSLELVITQLDDHNLTSILKNITQQVKKGESFSGALKKFPETFDPIVIQLITSGEKTGNLILALTYLSTHLKEQNTFKKTLLQAALFPLFTITFAVIILLGILLFIIPQFETFFGTMDKALPPLTQGIITLSAWLRSWKGLAFALTAAGGALAFNYITPKNITQNIMHKIPLLGTIIITANLINILHMLSLFLKAGIPLKDALETISASIKNHHLNKKLHAITLDISAGQSLSSQLPQLAPAKETELLATFVALGQQTGKLDLMLDKAAAIFEEKLKKQIALFTLFFQPALMIIVGLIIALLMAAVYLPLFNLAYSVS